MRFISVSWVYFEWEYYWTFFGTSLRLCGEAPQDWSLWDLCDVTCGVGLTKRSRTVKAHTAAFSLHSKFVGIKSTCPKKVFEVSLDLIDESPKIHRRCLPATGVRSSGFVSVRLPGFPAKEASWGSSSLHWQKELSSLVVFPPFSTGLECGSLAENKTCDNGDCPVDCALSEWGLFLSFHANYIKISIILIAIIKHPQSSPFVQPLMDAWEANGVLVTAPVRQSQTSESVAWTCLIDKSWHESMMNRWWHDFEHFYVMSLIELILSWDESVMTGKRFRSIVVTISVSFPQEKFGWG